MITVVVVATVQIAPMFLFAPIAIRLVIRFGVASAFGNSSFVLRFAALIVAIVTAMGRLRMITLFLWLLSKGIFRALTSSALSMPIRQLAPREKLRSTTCG